jgi:predicted extracellular nuclease
VKAARFRLGACIALALVTLVGAASTQASGSPNLVISQVYGGGGNTGATLTNDFIEIFNRGSVDLPLSGYSVQYGSTAGNIGANDGQITPLSGTIAAGQYVLVQEAQGAGGSTPLSADITDATSIAMSGTGGKVALVNSAAGLNCGATGTTANPCSAAALASIVDLVGYDGATMFETAATPTLSNTTAALRNGAGCTDTDNNSADFTVGAPDPRNRATSRHTCDVPTNPGISVTSSPADPNPGTLVTMLATVARGTNPASTGLAVTCNLGWAGLGTATFFDDGTNGDAIADDLVFTRQFTVPSSAEALPRTGECQVTDDQFRSGATTYTINVTAPAPVTPIHDIQGAAHTSPKVGTSVTNVQGIVTATSTNGYWMQDPNPDTDPATSEGIFVFTSARPAVAVGDLVKVNARVQEFRPGGASNGNLTTTELSSATTSVLSTGNSLPPVTVIGNGGRVPPNQVIEDDASSGNVETSGVFDPDQDGLDFYESLEGMRVQVNNAVAVGPTNSFGETPIVGDNGANAGPRTIRGGVLLRPDDGNPERVIVDDVLTPSLPDLNVGDGYDGPIVGVMDYNFGNPFIEVTNAVGRVDNHLQREVTDASGPVQLSVATFNFENLAATNPQSKFDQLASLIVNNLKSPDLLAGEEVQDNNGATDDGTVAATLTLSKLVAAISAAGGPSYEWREIDPVDDQDGGEPGGNIRQVFLFRTDRGLAFVDRPGGSSTTPVGVTGTGSSTQLTSSPGRIAPSDGAWSSSRKPLAGEFTYHGSHLFVIVNHFNSKGGDDPLRGRFQPPNAGSETQRHQQAHLVADFVSQITAADPDANVVVLGDLNDFEFSQTVGILEAAGLHDLMDTLPLEQRYSYEFEGNAQVLDHILFSGNLFAQPFAFDPVHVNAEFWDQASDHDPSVVRVRIVTFTSLCDLVQEVVSDPVVAQSLCDKLAAAAAAAARGNTAAEANQLKAFRSQVDAQTGKSISSADAALLKSLSTRL